jgi:endonuclease YncB( thermonuclease family)
MRLSLAPCLLAFSIMTFLVTSLLGAESISAGALLEGTATVIDGDTLEIHGQRIRLDAIDAPESRQQCWHKDGAPYPCGRRSAFALADKIGRAPVKCAQKGHDRYRRIIAVCYLDGQNLNGWMVEQGWAVAFRKYGIDYISLEEHARNTGRGMWEGRFEMPWTWRASDR